MLCYNIMDYKNKYLKYKNKYLNLKEQIGGSFVDTNFICYCVNIIGEYWFPKTTIKYNNINEINGLEMYDIDLRDVTSDNYDTKLVNSKIKLIEELKNKILNGTTIYDFIYFYGCDKCGINFNLDIYFPCSKLCNLKFVPTEIEFCIKTIKQSINKYFSNAIQMYDDRLIGTRIKNYIIKYFKCTMSNDNIIQHILNELNLEMNDKIKINYIEIPNEIIMNLFGFNVNDEIKKHICGIINGSKPEEIKINPILYPDKLFFRGNITNKNLYKIPIEIEYRCKNNSILKKLYTRYSYDNEINFGLSVIRSWLINAFEHEVSNSRKNTDTQIIKYNSIKLNEIEIVKITRESMVDYIMFYLNNFSYGTRYVKKLDAHEIKLDVMIDSELPPILKDKERFEKFIGNLEKYDTETDLEIVVF